MGINQKEAVAALHRERMLTAAEELFQQKGFEATTIDDISKVSGYSRRTLYAYFVNKEDFLRQIVRKGLAQLDGALEAALRLKDRVEGSTVHILTMGPQRAADIIRDAMFRGADGGYLLSGREFAGSDTLATSYALSCALKKIRPDIIFAGRQAIDGDTAQVGPQVAEKLGLPQVTYAEEILDIKDSTLVIRRRLNCGTETVECPVPAVITVNASAPECRPRNAKRVMTYKFALSGSEIAAAPESEAARRAAAKPYLQIVEWAAADVDPDPQQLGLQGSPTKVKKIENVVFQAKEAKKLTAADEDINSLMVELIASHTLG